MVDGDRYSPSVTLRIVVAEDNLLVREVPVVIGAAFRATFLHPKMIGAFANELFGIEHASLQISEGRQVAGASLKPG